MDDLDNELEYNGIDNEFLASKLNELDDDVERAAIKKEIDDWSSVDVTIRLPKFSIPILDKLLDELQKEIDKYK